jgi:PAS domain S-box-containing protein
MIGEQYTGKIVKQAVFCPIKLGNTFWSIIVSTPDNEIIGMMQGFIRRSIVVISIFIVIITFLIYILIKYWSQQREEEIIRSSEKALRESEERYHTIFNQAPLGIMQFDNQGIIVEINDNFKDIMGYPREKIIGYDLLDQLKDEAMLEAVKTTLQGQRGYYEGDYFSGTANKLISLRAVYNFLKDDNGNLVGGIGIFEDITQRKQAQEMLEEQIFFLQTLIDSMPFPIFYKDAMGKYLGCNTAFEHFTGISRNEMIGKNVFEVYPPDLAGTYYYSDSEMVKQEVKHDY